MYAHTLQSNPPYLLYGQNISCIERAREIVTSTVWDASEKKKMTTDGTVPNGAASNAADDTAAKPKTGIKVIVVGAGK